MLVAESRMVMGKAHVFHVGSLSYLQLVEVSEQTMQRYQQVGKVTRGLRQLARQLRISIICLSQLSRKTEENGIGRPSLSAMRESGNIEQDACVVLGLWVDTARQEAEVQDGKKPCIQAINVDILKNRNGAGDASLPYSFYRPFTLFSPHIINNDQKQKNGQNIKMSRKEQKAADDLFHMTDRTGSGKR